MTALIFRPGPAHKLASVVQQASGEAVAWVLLRPGTGQVGISQKWE